MGLAPSCHSTISLNVTSSVRPTLATFGTPPLLASHPDPCSLAPYLLPSHYSSQVIIIFLVFLFSCLHSCFSLATFNICSLCLIFVNLCFWTVVLEKTLESPLDCREIQTVHSKEISPGCSLEGMMLKLKLQYFGHLM